jgi:unsaturated chondroitin disaccharide hydrolase
MKKKKSTRILSALTLLSLAALAMHLVTRRAEAQSVTGCTDQALALAEGQLTDTLAYTSTSQFPVETNPSNANKWTLLDNTHWTSGFFPGALWFMYEKGLSNSWFTRAQAQTSAMQGQETNASDHDIGFKILTSFGNGYRITRDPAYMAKIQTAAQAMTTLYRPGAGVIESWPNYDSHITVIIDNMMNLELLFLGAQNGGDPAWYNMAVSHALKTMQNHVRADGSTYHVVDYNADGTVFSKFTAQGAGTETTWARGQAWGIYGFTMTYRYTKDPQFLATAQRLADYFIANLPPDFVPYWDFSKCCTDPRDSSAAAIAAAGLLELSNFVTLQTDKDRYRNAALNIQSSLSSAVYLGDRLATDGILLHGSANVPGGDSDKSLIYGDYYFLQGCYRAKPLPTIPTNLTVARASDTQMDLTWDAQLGPTRYSVKRSSTSGGPYNTISPPPVLTTSAFNDTTVAGGSTYYYVVSAINMAGEGPDSAEASTPISNPLPTVSSISPTNAPAGADFALTVNGANFLANSVVNFNGKPEPTTFASSTKLTATIPASDVSASNSPAVTVSNVPPSGGLSAAVSFAVDDFALSGPNALTVAAGNSGAIPITVTPSNTNGFANSIALSVSGLPPGATATFNPPSLTPGTNPVSTTLTITTAAHSGMVRPDPSWPRGTVVPIWLTLWTLAAIAVLLLLRQSSGAIFRTATMASALIGSAILSGCAGGSPSSKSPPPSASAQTFTLTVTAQSGSDTKTSSITLTIH